MSNHAKREGIRKGLLDTSAAALRQIARALEGGGADSAPAFVALQRIRALLDDADPILVEDAIRELGSVKSAAAALGLPLRSVWNRIEKAGLETPGPQKSPVTVEAVRRKLAAEIPVAEIAQEYGVSRETVYRRAKDGRRRK